jgi:hypothetical protein
MSFDFNTLFETDYRKSDTADLYKDAVVFGGEYADDFKSAEHVAWYAAWYAARVAAGALMAEAADMGLTPEQRERLREVAAKVAYD